MYKHPLFILCCLWSTFVHGQSNPEHLRFFGRNWSKGMIYMSASTGKDKYYRNFYSFDDLRSDTRNASSFYAFNHEEFNQYHTYALGNSTYEAGISFFAHNKSNIEDKRHELKFSLLYYKGIDTYIHFSNRYHPNTWVQGFDTTFTSYVTYDQIMDQAGLGISWYIRSHPILKRLQLFTGLGAAASVTVFSKVRETVDVYSFRSECVATSSGTYCYTITDDNVSERYYNGNHALSVRALVPYGLDFMLLRDLHLYIEGRSGFSWQKFLSGKSRIRTQQSIGIGVRFRF